MNRPTNGSDNRFGSAKGRSPLAGSKPVRRPQTAAARPSAPILMGRTDPGPRPVSTRQQELRDRNRVTGRDIIDRAVPPQAAAVLPAERNWRTDANRRHVRDAETTQVRRRRSAAAAATATPVRNRKRVSPWPRLLRWSIAALAVECVAVSLWSPRFRVTKTTVVGNTTVPTDKLVADLAVPAHRTLPWLAVGKMRKSVLNEAPIESASIHRSLPGTVRLVVKERIPWASVCLPGGSCYTIDRKLVPFRLTGASDKALPRLILGTGSVSSGNVASPVLETTPPQASLKLGKPLTTPGLELVSGCLAWASAHQFPLDSVTIAPDGELCLNRTGGMVVKLGSGIDLDKKLNSLSALLDRKPSLRGGNDIASVNLLAYEAPAILPRVVTVNPSSRKRSAPPQAVQPVEIASQPAANAAPATPSAAETAPQ